MNKKHYAVPLYLAESAAPQKTSLPKTSFQNATAPPSTPETAIFAYADQGVKITPMFEQYLSIKQDYPDALLFYRMGDFYELFFEDAVTAARELQLTLTSRNPKNENPVPMAGVPHHALETYLPQLLDKAYKVVICDQIENPKDAKGLVKRAVTRILTPGTVVDESSLSVKEHNYLGALFWNEDKGAGGFAWADNSTGSWSGLQSAKEADLWQWVQKIAPKELLLPEMGGKFRQPKSIELAGILVLRVPFASYFGFKSALERVLKAQGVKDPDTLGLGDKNELVQACGALVGYLTQTQRSEPRHLAPFVPLNISKHLVIDDVTERNLEIFRRLDGKKGLGTLVQVLDHTVTPMGGRLLEERLRQPWRELAPILDTQSIVAHFAAEPEKLKAVRESLQNVYDVERLSTRISLNRALPRDFGALRQSLCALPSLFNSLQKSRLKEDLYLSADEASGKKLPAPLFALLKKWDSISDIGQLLDKSLAESLPQLLTEGGLFKVGYNAELDELMDLAEHGQERLQELLAKEQFENNLPKLRLTFNRVFGYMLELSHGASDKAPEHFTRRQTLANAERYTTPALKELENKLMEATERRNNLEYKLFQELRAVIAEARARFMFMANIISVVDYWQSLASAALKNGWVKPELHTGLEIGIRQGRHPVVEAIQGQGNFIPNDLHMDERRRLILITGPNMSGKSTVLRQTAIIMIMAQMGSFVPAAEAYLGMADRVFSRVGASDNLAQGQSTFMVEMMETARILRQASKKSLIILDEIGRGTSTYDGLALAWAVVEDLTMRAGGSVRTLFATHYHELTGLDGRLPGVHNMNVAIREFGGELIFLRRLVPGPSNRSYGIEVARLAGVPATVVQRARQILGTLDRASVRLDFSALDDESLQFLPGLEQPRQENEQNDEDNFIPPEHPMLTTLKDLNVEAISPMQALSLLHDWKLLWGKKNE